MSSLSTAALALVIVSSMVWDAVLPFPNSLYRSCLGLPGDTARKTDFGINLPETVRATLARGTDRRDLGTGERAYQSHAKAGRGDVLLPASTQVGIGEARWKSGESQLGVAAGAGQLGARFQGYAAARWDGSQGNSLAVAGAQVAGQGRYAETDAYYLYPAIRVGEEAEGGEPLDGGTGPLPPVQLSGDTGEFSSTQISYDSERSEYGLVRVGDDTPAPGDLVAGLRVGGIVGGSAHGTLAELVSDRSGRPMEVRLTYYTDRGVTRWGCDAGPGIVATDPAVIPARSVVRFAGREYIACDTGSLVKQNHIDVWVASEAEGRALIREFGDYTNVEVMP